MSNISEYGTLTKAPQMYKWEGSAHTLVELTAYRELEHKLAAAHEVLTRIHKATNIVSLREAMHLAGLCLKEIEK